MALVIKDRVKETTNTTGNHTNDYDLLGAVSGFEAFSANMSGNDTTYYVCTDNTSFEIGIGTYNSSTDKLARTTILASSNSNNSVVWSSGTRTIFMTYPADKAVFKDASNNINGTFVGNITGDVTGNADTATTLETARTINGTSFNGSASITVTAAAGTLTGSTLNSGVTASSLTSLGTLASNLNLGGQDIVTTTSNQDIDLQTHGTGKVVVKGNTDDSGSNPGAIKLNCEANSHGQTIIAAPHSETASNTLTLPSTGGNARLVTTSSTATLTNKTFDVEGTGNSISNIDVADLKSGVLDTDISSVSSSDDTLASAKAIKTYVDAQVTAQDLDIQGDSGGALSIDLDSETLTIAGGEGIDTSGSSNTITIAGENATTSNKGIASFSDTFFSVSSGAVSLDAAQTGITSVLNASLVIGRDADNDIDFSTDNNIIFRANGADQIKLTDGALVPVTDNDVDLGTSSLEFKDAFFDGTVTADAFAGPLTGDVTGNLTGNADTATKVYVDESEDDNLFYNIIFENTHPAGNGYSSMQVDDNGLQFNPGTNTLSTGVLNATTLTGTLSTAAQGNVTSLGTLTTLTVDNVIVNGTTIGHTDDTDLMTVADGVLTVAGEVSMTTLDIGGTNVTATATELNIMDGVTATTSELNIMDGVTSTTAELNILDGVTATASELNIMDGVTSTTAELNILDGVTATASELNIMDGVTATTAELNYSDGVTSNIQTQLDTKATKGFATAMAIAL